MREPLVHLGARHATTGKVGNYATPLEQVSTVCASRWSTRPQRTTLPTLVTCPACQRYMADHRVPADQLFDGRMTA